MVEVTPNVLIVVSIAAFLIGLTKAGLGGGLGPAVTAIVVLVLPVDEALSVLLPMLIVGDLLALISLWGKWDRRSLPVLGIGAGIGLGMGIYMLATVSADSVRTMIAVIALSYVAYRIVAPYVLRETEIAVPNSLGVLAGMVGGFGSAIAHSGGPPVSIFLLMRKVQPVAYTSTILVIFTAANVIKVPAYVATGLFDWELQRQLAPTLLLIPLGVVAGRWLLHRVSPIIFDRAITVILAITGVQLLLR